MNTRHYLILIFVAALSGYIAGGRAGRLPESFSSMKAGEFILVDRLGNQRARLYLSGADEEGIASGNPVLTISDPLGRVIATYRLEDRR